MRLSIIIPTKERSEVFAETLAAAMKAIEHVDAEIVVVNDSKMNVPMIPDNQRVVLINNEKSGVASARNLGFRHANGELILFLDNDILISKGSIDHVLRLHEQYPNICLNVNWEYSPEMLEKMSSLPFGRFLKASGMHSFKGWYDHPSWRENALFSSRSVASFHLSVSRKSFERSGGYNEHFPYAGFEDYDFPLRLRSAGLDFYIDTRVTVFHNEIDRLDLDNWLKSQELRAITRKKAVALGYNELTLEYSLSKRFFLWVIERVEWVLKMAIKTFPNRPVADQFYFKLLSALQASRICRGYTYTRP